MGEFKNPFEGDLTPLRRGEYVVRHVAGCMECHTPRKVALAFDEDRLLSGIENLFDVDPPDDTKGAISAPNLTPDPETGLGTWTDGEIKSALLDGISRTGTPLHPTMPSFVYHNMTADDADAIILYLRSIPPLKHAVPPRQPLLVEPKQAANPIPLGAIPSTTLDPSHADYAAAERGKYLASRLSVCIFCHTEETTPGDPDPIRLDKLFMGRRQWAPIALGEPVAPGTPHILAKNLTPTENGLAGWTADDVLAAVRWGRDRENGDLCPPMPYGPEGSFGLMLDSDAHDIGVYLTTLAQRDNGKIGECCPTCHTGDGGILSRALAGTVMPVP